MMEARVLEFAGLLRQNGVRVSSAELVDAVQALSLLGFDNREQVRAALAATLIKRAEDERTFAHLFELFFGQMGRLLQGLEQSLVKGLDPGEFRMEELQAIGRALAGMGESAPLSSALIEGRVGDIARLLRAAALQVDFRSLASPLQRGFFARRVLSNMAGAGGLRGELSRLEEALALEGVDSAQIERVSATVQEAMKTLEQAARRVAEIEYQARDRELLFRESNSLRRRSIASLRPEELKQMQDLVRDLAQKLKSRLSRRRKSSRKGQVHVRHTLRKNLQLGGFPAVVVRRRKRPERPDVVVLCDVSDSVRGVSSLMLLFLHTLQSNFSRLRSFVFVSDLAEITEKLKETTVEEATSGAFLASVLNLSANSNYGRALRDFHHDFLGAVSRKTTLIIIGDGRSNHQPAESWVLKELKGRAKRVWWLCPEARSSWGFGDSEMYAYSRHCDGVFTVRTLDELANAAQKVVD